MAFRLSIISPDKVLWNGEAESLIAPGAEGELTVLSSHEPLMTTLKAGKLFVRGEKETPKEIAIDGGVLEVSRNQATVLL